MRGIDRLAPLSGLAFAVLFGVGSGIWAFDQPSRGADSREILAFFEHSSTEVLVGGTMSLISIVFMVWFGAVLRERLLAAEGGERGGLPLVAFAGAVLAAAAGLGAETINMAGALSAEDGQLTADTAQIYFDVSYAFGAHAAGVTFALIALPVGLVSLRTSQIVPRWAAWLALILGLALLTPALLFRPAFLALYSLTVLLTAALSIHLYKQSASRNT